MASLTTEKERGEEAKDKTTSSVTKDNNVDELDLLLAKHRTYIETLKERVKDLLVDNPDTESETIYDDIWILRYVLSNIKNSAGAEKGLKQAENSMRRSILWRKENAKLLKNIKAGGHPLLDEHVKKYISVFRSYAKDGGPVNIVSLKYSNPGGLMDNTPVSHPPLSQKKSKKETKQTNNNSNIHKHNLNFYIFC